MTEPSSPEWRSKPTVEPSPANWRVPSERWTLEQVPFEMSVVRTAASTHSTRWLRSTLRKTFPLEVGCWGSRGTYRHPSPSFEPHQYPQGSIREDHVVHKTYRYRILQSKVRDPFLDNSAWRIEQRLNLDLMRAEANDLVGTHDFAAFRGAQDQRPETNRTIFHATLQPDPADRRILWIEINGNKFLYHMVRIIVGTMVDVGRGRTNPGAVRTALASLNRNDLGMTAPPQGLFLSHIQLDEPVADVWPAADDSITTT